MDKSTPAYWQQACDVLSSRDAVMASIISQYTDEIMRSRGDPFQTLARSIVGQQISVKAADSVWNRLEQALCTLTPERLLEFDEDELRACGLSRQKSRYLLNIAEFCESCDWQELQQLESDEIRQRLISIKGVGQWTWEMFAIFYLQLPDIFPIGDAGLISACNRSYGLADREAIIRHSRMWQPYRTVATWFLWRSLDPVAIAY